MGESTQSSLNACQPMGITRGHCTFYSAGNVPSQEVAGGFDNILGGLCIVSFLGVLLDQLSAPIVCLCSL